MKTFKGMCVPICTPFVEGGEAVDEGALKAHIDWMIENGIHIILSCTGTRHNEHLPMLLKVQAALSRICC